MAIANSYNFRKVNDALTTSGVIGGNRLKGLAAEGYEVVINLLPDDNEHAVPEEGDIVEAQGVEYVYIPVDFAQPRADDFACFVQAMDAAQGRKTHVHCAANYRVSAFYSLYAVQKGLWTEAEAQNFVHDLWRPADFPAWTRFMDDIAR